MYLMEYTIVTNTRHILSSHLLSVMSCY